MLPVVQFLYAMDVRLVACCSVMVVLVLMMKKNALQATTFIVFNEYALLVRCDLSSFVGCCTESDGLWLLCFQSF